MSALPFFTRGLSKFPIFRWVITDPPRWLIPWSSEPIMGISFFKSKLGKNPCDQQNTLSSHTRNNHLDIHLLQCGLGIADCGLLIINVSSLVISQSLRRCLKNSFLTTDLHAETTVHTGQSVDLHTAILSSHQRWTFEPFKTVSTSNAGTHRWHLYRRCWTFLDTDTTTRAFFIVNDITNFCFGNGSLRTLDHAGVTLITGPTMKTSLRLRKNRLLIGQ